MRVCVFLLVFLLGRLVLCFWSLGGVVLFVVAFCSFWGRGLIYEGGWGGGGGGGGGWGFTVCPIELRKHFENRAAVCVLVLVAVPFETGLWS